MNEEEISHLVTIYEDNKHEFKVFMDGVQRFVGDHPSLNDPNAPIMHSHKSRLKDSLHLADKLRRKSKGVEINEHNLFDVITDLAGVRFLHLFQDGFGAIDGVIRKRVADGYWCLGEQPKAYTWDPEAASFFDGFDLNVVEKETSYTSVHYLVRPRSDSPYCCEIQVRTLFEEIWGEVDHQINYPVPTDSLACREQIRVLSKIVGAGSRLLDSLSRVHAETKVKPG